MALSSPTRSATGKTRSAKTGSATAGLLKVAQLVVIRLCGECAYLHELKNGLTTGTDNRHAIEIEKRLVAAQASALYTEFGFGHCD